MTPDRCRCTSTNAVAVQHGRRGRAPAETRRQRRELVSPEFLAFQVKTEHADVAEVAIDSFAVRHRRLRRIAALEVNRRLRLPFVDLPSPSEPCRCASRGTTPSIGGPHRAAVGRSPPKYSPFFGDSACARVDDRREKDSVAPHHRRRPAASRNVLSSKRRSPSPTSARATLSPPPRRGHRPRETAAS